MKEKQHKLIIKAFLASKIPQVIRQRAPELIAVDSMIGGYCNQLLKGNGQIKWIPNQMITKDEIAIFSKLINDCTGVEKDELIIYYRLMRLTESVLYSYSQNENAQMPSCVFGKE